MPKDGRQEVTALVVNQWLPEWSKITFSVKNRREPDHFFYLFSIKATWLRKLSGIYRRRAEGKRIMDPSAQRGHTIERSREISQFIRGGFPWSELSERQRTSPEYENLRMPGWLSTAIIANIVAPGTSRMGSTINKSETIEPKRDGNGSAKLRLPVNFEDKNWKPAVRPLEIIDGQHRLLALDEDNLIGALGDDYELPVVAFNNLDITWQAYLFYTINIKPKKINPSLAYDLYPLLRTQEWLEASPSRANVYRDTRAQELTETLWAYEKSPWHKRINMLGESAGGTVTQAAFIRSLKSTFVKRREGRGVGGLFGAELADDSGEVLYWGRTQQAAFLIDIWQTIELAINRDSLPWSKALQSLEKPRALQSKSGPKAADYAFTSKFSLLASDQGVRGILHVFNDMCFLAEKDLDLNEWSWKEDIDAEGIELTEIAGVMKSIPANIKVFIKALAADVVKFEWRNSSAPGLSREESLKQMVYRGSGGYKQLRIELLGSLRRSTDPQIKRFASEVCKTVGI